MTRPRPPVPITPAQVFFGICAVVGLLVVGWAAVHADGTGLFFLATHNYGVVTISNDLLFIAIPVVAFMIIESYRINMRWPWIWVPLIIPLPGAFVIPLFFLLRERALLRIRAEENAERGNAR